MIKTSGLVTKIDQVDERWIYQYYACLQEELTGQDVCIHSVFRTEKTPSLKIYLTPEGHYRFKDWGGSAGGDAVEFVKQLFKVDYKTAVKQILADYNDYVINGGAFNPGEYKRCGKFRITDYLERSWNTDDRDYWTQYGIGSKILTCYNIRPLLWYRMDKEEDGKVRSIVIENKYLYGYFTKDGVLARVYQPKIREKKMIVQTGYIQGEDQLTGKKILAIISSMKDGLCMLDGLKLKEIEFTAPNSETSLIPAEKMNKWLKEYRYVILIHDYDAAGMESAVMYQQAYPSVIPVTVSLLKDLSDSYAGCGRKAVLEKLIPSINMACSLVDEMRPPEEELLTINNPSLWNT
jgi:hypothetical protein